MTAAGGVAVKPRKSRNEGDALPATCVPRPTWGAQGSAGREEGRLGFVTGGERRRNKRPVVPVVGIHDCFPIHAYPEVTPPPSRAPLAIGKGSRPAVRPGRLADRASIQLAGSN